MAEAIISNGASPPVISLRPPAGKPIIQTLDSLRLCLPRVCPFPHVSAVRDADGGARGCLLNVATLGTQVCKQPRAHEERAAPVVGNRVDLEGSEQRAMELFQTSSLICRERLLHRQVDGGGSPGLRGGNGARSAVSTAPAQLGVLVPRHRLGKHVVVLHGIVRHRDDT
eukprot:scaffold62927_cov32-Tisochrysis_lutea.AAC.5